MKRLGGTEAKAESAPEARKNTSIKKDADVLLTTPNVRDSSEAVQDKMKQIHPKLFGLFCPVKYDLVEKEKVYVPYLFLIFHYRLIRSSKKAENQKLGMFDKEGRIAVVYDMNECHSFHFDLFDDLNLEKTSKNAINGKLMKPNCTVKQAVEDATECVKWQYLRKVYHALPEITLESSELFYREAVKLNLECKNKEYEKFAYMDNFGAQNEHVSGLRVRLDV